MLKWIRRARTGANPDRPASPGPATPEPEGFAAAWETLQLAEIGHRTFDRHPLSDAERSLIALLEPLLREQYRNHPPVPAAFPAVAVQVLALLEGEDPQASALLHLVSQDPALSLRLLQVANSALYHRGRDVHDLQAALMKLGVRATGEAVTALAGRSLYDPGLKAELAVHRPRLRELYRSAMTVAFTARAWSERTGIGHPHQGFLAGMFHDLGHSLALRALAGLSLAGKVPKDLPAHALDALLERTHVDMGATALAIWNLPAHLVRLCAQHHEAEVPAWVDRQDLHVLRVVSGLERLARDPNDPRQAAETRQSVEALCLDRPALRELFIAVKANRELVVELFPL